MKNSFTTQRIYTRAGGMRDTFGDFVCQFCHTAVPAGATLSGVHHRNHCPYCLYSRHLDLYEAGDRLSACKGRMRPIGVTLKRAPRKYGSERQGELMLIHQCEACGTVSINRIAADDNNAAILTVFDAAAWSAAPTQARLAEAGIVPLTLDDMPLVQSRLYGRLDTHRLVGDGEAAAPAHGELSDPPRGSSQWHRVQASP